MCSAERRLVRQGTQLVRDYLRECQVAAELTGDRNDYWLASDMLRHLLRRDRRELRDLSDFVGVHQ